jgi:hypothetical protein
MRDLHSFVHEANIFLTDKAMKKTHQKLRNKNLDIFIYRHVQLFSQIPNDAENDKTSKQTGTYVTK